MKAFVTGGSGFVGKALIAALRAQGHEVKALARSAEATQAVKGAGAEPVAGDLDEVAALRSGMTGCDWVFHSAAYVKDWGPRELYWKVNVQGTQNVLDAAKTAGVKRVVHISSEAVLVGGGPIVNVDETRPLPERPIGRYSWSKGEAERRVRAACDKGQDTVIVRPRFVWGKGDNTLVPIMTRMVRTGAFRWIGGGQYKTSTAHVRNVCEGLLLAAERGRSGEIYFLTDGPPVDFKPFITDMLATQGVSIPDKTAPRPLVKALAAAAEGVWQGLALSGEPPLTRQAVMLAGEEVTVNDAKARRELGYVGKVTIAEGLEEMKVG